MPGTTNGSTAYGEAAAEKIIKDEHKPSAPSQTSEDDMQLVLQNFRLLIADLCQQFGMGMESPRWKTS
jgi:dihydroxyacetone synthase